MVDFAFHTRSKVLKNSRELMRTDDDSNTHTHTRVQTCADIEINQMDFGEFDILAYNKYMRRVSTIVCSDILIAPTVEC